jgi:hypothetical protein
MSNKWLHAVHAETPQLGVLQATLMLLRPMRRLQLQRQPQVSEPEVEEQLCRR